MPKLKHFTPSTFIDLIPLAKGKKLTKKGENIILKYATELMNTKPEQEKRTPAACEWGNEYEPVARMAYEERTFKEVRLAEFKKSPNLKYVGGSMDGLVGEHGGIEIKCPASNSNHFLNLQNNFQLHELYWYQVQGYMWIYELEWIDFISYNPNFKKPYDLKVVHVLPDMETINLIIESCKLAHKQALEINKEIRKQRTNSFYILNK